MRADEFLKAVKKEVESARVKFPVADGSMCALTEEVGELAKALLDEPWSRVVAEAIQVAAMACRVATEGDRTLNKIRDERGVPPTCRFRGCGNRHGNYGPCALCYE